MKNILITGASSGIGAALAKAYAAPPPPPSTQLFLIGRSAERLNEVANHCALLGAIVQKKIIDVVNHEKLLSWVSAIDEAQPA